MLRNEKSRSIFLNQVNLLIKLIKVKILGGECYETSGIGAFFLNQVNLLIKLIKVKILGGNAPKLRE